MKDYEHPMIQGLLAGLRQNRKPDTTIASVAVADEESVTLFPVSFEMDTEGYSVENAPIFFGRKIVGHISTDTSSAYITAVIFKHPNSSKPELERETAQLIDGIKRGDYAVVGTKDHKTKTVRFDLRSK